MVSTVTDGILNTSVLPLQPSIFFLCKPTFGSSYPYTSGHRSSQPACLHFSGAGLSWAAKLKGAAQTSTSPVVTKQPVGCLAPDCYWQSISTSIWVSCKTQWCGFHGCMQVFFTAILLYKYFGYIKGQATRQIPSTEKEILLKNKSTFCTPSKRSF